MVYTINSNTFTNRKIIKITSTEAVDDYQINLTITYESTMQADFDDIRFVTSDGNNTNIPYWLESKTNSVTASVWIKHNLVVGSNYIWMYYGNSGLSSASSGDNTFAFFDDFSGDLSKWNNNTGSASISGGLLTLSSAANVISKTSVNFPCILYSKHERTADVVWVGMTDVNTATSTNGDAIHTNDGWSLGCQATASYLTSKASGTYSETASLGAISNTYIEHRCSYSTNSLVWTKDGAAWGTKTNDVPIINLYPFFISFRADPQSVLNVDLIYVRKYITTEPTIVYYDDDPFSLVYKVIYDNFFNITKYVSNFILEKEQGKLLDRLKLDISRNIDNASFFSSFNPNNEITLEYNGIGIFRGRIKSEDKKYYYEIEIFSSGEILNRTTANKTYINMSPESIFSDLITTYTDLTPVVSSSGTIINYFIAYDYIDQILTKLSQTLDWEFFTDSDKNIYFQPRGNTINSTIIYRNTTINNAVFDKWKRNFNELYNNVELTGASLSYSTIDTFIGDGTTKIFTLSNVLPENVKITIDNVEISSTSYSVIKSINQIIFTTAPTNGSSIYIYYSYTYNVYVQHSDTTSITSYGTFTKKISNNWIESRSDALNYANTFIETYKDPQLSNTLIMHNPYITIFNIGEQVHIIDGIENYDDYYVINKIKVEYKKAYIELNIGSYIPNFTNIQGIVKSRINDLENKFSAGAPQLYIYKTETITPSETFNDSQTSSINLRNVLISGIARCNFGRGTLYDARVGLCIGS